MKKKKWGASSNDEHAEWIRRMRPIPYSTVIQPEKGKKFLWGLQWGWTPRTLCWVKWESQDDKRSMISVTGGPESTRFEDGKEDGWLPRTGRSWEEQGMGNCCFKETVCFTEWKVMAVDDGDNGCWTIWMYLVPLNCTDGKSCVMYISPKL